MQPTRGTLAYAAAGVGLGFAAGRLSMRRPVAPSLSGAYRNSSCDDVLFYEPDGRLTCIARAKDGKALVGSIGRWRLHNASTSFAATYPPHDGDMVEHCITAASDASLVGSGTVMRYVLADGELTLSTMALSEGQSTPTSTTTWRRVALATAGRE